MSEAPVCGRESYNAKNWLHFCRRHYRSGFSQFNVQLAPKASLLPTALGEMTAK